MKGATVKLHFVGSMWQGNTDTNGIKDDRGPCGCHLHPGSCQFITVGGADRIRTWVSAMDKAKPLADGVYNGMVDEFYDDHPQYARQDSLS